VLRTQPKEAWALVARPRLAFCPRLTREPSSKAPEAAQLPPSDASVHPRRSANGEAHLGFPFSHTVAIKRRIASCRVSRMSSCATIQASSKSSFMGLQLHDHGLSRRGIALACDGSRDTIGRMPSWSPRMSRERGAAAAAIETQEAASGEDRGGHSCGRRA
jgi:hypothetical protein